jgi:phosphonate transport system substrate-binding protein
MQRLTLMQRLGLGVVAGGVLVGLGCSQQSSSDGDGHAADAGERFGNGTLNFVMSPSEPQAQLRAQYGPLKDYLSEALGLPVTLKYARNYSAVISALGSGTGDVAEMGPFAAALGVRAGDVEIALQRYAYGSWQYTSVLVTRADSEVTGLRDLRGGTVAFADRLSASGSLFPMLMLKDAGLAIGNLPGGSGRDAAFDASFAGHAQAFKALKAGMADAAGVGEFITLRDGANGRRVPKQGIRYLKKTSGIPRAPICVSPRLSEDEQNALIEAMVNAPRSAYLGVDQQPDTEDDLWFSDVRPATVETYQPVIDAATTLGIKRKMLNP